MRPFYFMNALNIIYDVQLWPLTCFLMASKVSTLIHAPFDRHLFFFTPSVMSQSGKTYAAHTFSQQFSAFASQMDISSSSISIFYFHNKFFIATLTLGFVYSSSLTISIERTVLFSFLSGCLKVVFCGLINLQSQTPSAMIVLQIKYITIFVIDLIFIP